MDKLQDLNYNKKTMDTPKGQDDSRRYERIPFNKEILINNSITANAIDISPGGLYVHTSETFKRSTVVDLSIPFKDETLNLKAIVKHEHPGVGMGLMFVDLDNIKKDRILDLINYIKRTPSRPRPDKPVVLLVDDNEMSRKMLKNKLHSEGFWVIEAPNGVEAIKCLEDNPINVTVLDLYMDKMDGFKVLSIIRGSSKWKNMPVIVLSAKGSDEVIDSAITAGADDFLLKMVTSPAKLADLIRTLLQRQETDT